MNKLDYNFATLLNELQAYESLMKVKEQHGEVNVVSSSMNFHKGSTSRTKHGPSSSGSKKWKKKNGGKGNKVAPPTAAQKSKKAKAANGICFY